MSLQGLLPTYIPLVYEIDNNLRVKDHYYLGDKEAIQDSIESIKKQYINNKSSS